MNKIDAKHIKTVKRHELLLEPCFEKLAGMDTNLQDLPAISSLQPN
jgi:hypothetical protein